MVVPLSGRFVEHHHSLECETKLNESSLAQIGAKPAGVFKIIVAGELRTAQALDHLIQLFSLELPGIHGDERCAGGLRELDEVLPALSSIIAGLPNNRLHFFVIDVPGKTADAMALNEGDHIVF